MPAIEASRKLLEQRLTELKTQSKRLESARATLQRARRRADEAKEQADREAAKILSELCALEQEAHKTATEATGTRPLDRCSDIKDSTTSALHQARAPTEQLDINGLHCLCSAAGTVTDEAEDQLMDFDARRGVRVCQIRKEAHGVQAARTQ